MNDQQINTTPSGLTVVQSEDSGERGGAGDHTETDAGHGEPEPMVSEPGKLMRIGMMLRELQQEVHRADVDEAGLERLGDVHGRALDGLRSVLSGELRDELNDLAPALPTEQAPTESEVRIAQAQLIGWLEGLFQGIQAAIASQQQAARQQLEQMRQQRGLPAGQARGEHGAGQYL